jgi:hypothetical protein
LHSKRKEDFAPSEVPARGLLVEDSPDITAKSGESVFGMTINGTKQITEWAPSDPSTYVYVGKADADRVNFIQSLLNSGTVSIRVQTLPQRCGNDQYV